MNIVTHVSPDFDAIVSVWLLQRFGGFEEASVSFVNTGNPDATLLENASAIVDTGKQFKPDKLRFDHHHLSGQAANDTCATMQVWQHLVKSSPSSELLNLHPLIDLIFYGDTGRPEANASRELGIHALLSSFKSTRPTDQAIMDYGFSILDALNSRLQAKAKARAELAEKTVYKSADSLVWAIKHGSQGSSFAAYDEGARLVIFEGEPIEVEGGITYPIGLMRGGEWLEPYCGKIVERIIEVCDYELASGTIGDFRFESNLKTELSRWFLHPAGFFAGRGTAKAPVFDPIAISLEALAQLVDRVWER